MNEGINRRRRGLVLCLLTLCVVSVDQASKVYAVAHWKGAAPQSFANDVFRIEYAENTGAFLSLLASTPEHVRFVVLTVLNGVVLAGLLIYLMAARRVAWWSFLALALVVAGGIGNLIDRIRFGFVIDYFNLGIGSLRTGIFNVADMAITAGFLILLPFAFCSEKSREATPTAAPAESGAS